MTEFKGFGKATKAKSASRTSRPDANTAATPSAAETLTLANQYYQTGQLEQAEKLYRQVLKQQPQPEALHRLGIIAQRSGRSKEAVTYLRRSLAVQPQDASAHNSLGIILAEQGEFADAIEHLQQAIVLNPNHFNAYSNLGNVRRLQGKLSEAQVNLETALALNANFAPAHGNLGVTLLELDDLDRAETHLRRAIALSPNFVDAHYNLAVVLERQHRPEAAIASYEKAIALNPSDVKAYTGLGNLLIRQDQLQPAIVNLQQALALSPNDAEIHSSLGWALQRQGELEAAAAHLRQAIVLDPTQPRAYGYLGRLLWGQGQVDQAIVHYRTAIQLDPESAEAHVSLAHVLLAIGDFRSGFAEFEWRWQLVPPCLLPQPEWDGSDLNGRAILLRVEGGFGDIIQFVRYAPLIADRGGRVFLVCQAALQRLLATVPGIEQVVTEGSLPEFAVHAPLISLPRLLGTTLESIPADIPYVSPPAESGLRLEPVAGTRLKVGLVWATGHKTSRDLTDDLNVMLRESQQVRSCPLPLLARLLAASDISFYSLQVGQDAADLSQLDGTAVLQDLSPQIQDFADTAALIDQMDLVISVDTAVAHLAGALGKPVWVLLPFAADWRWLLDRDDTPWYPTMRLFRQPSPGDWEHVIDRVAATLRSEFVGVNPQRP
jgi:tetratricopeptide (TPR) repeat protein